MFSTIEEFIKKESSSGILLIAVTLLALLLQNSFLTDAYTHFLHTPVHISIGTFGIAKPLLLWVNDGLMAIFFFLIGLEVKREVLEGELSSKSQIALPAIAALGGMIIPALVFTFFNHTDAFAMNGWAIPTATDIAFALGILSLLGNRVPVSLKIFLMALAIIDDLGAIVIIALFYTSDLSFVSISIALGSIVVLVGMNQLKVIKKAAYILVGIVLWISVLKSGVHATIAGVVLAFCIPLYSTTRKGEHFSMLKEMEHDLHYWVAFFILPLFAFVNAGVDLKDLAPSAIASDVSLGVILGLFLGKQVGVFGFSFLAIKLGFASLPTGSNFKQLYGVAILTGIGFTMSLFVNSLAYNDTDLFHYADKLAILLGSFLSGIVGYLYLHSMPQKIQDTLS
ncbi:Na+/H+ antiporter NhaA [Sulfurospirillum multivorans]|uniref:Na(+)/H(+) antiporter NhaA n=2 Tax=Sulfurospirillum multivorans TaxID=66821 RepID=A0AA86APH1_SULMK|nr:Na+/H+ antiporter NhaA [Sulfurospirillum multivorans]AHJ13228.1 Na+/H+ antiporter NhaA [Sulfurospirillum multivorans DSM 12446]QEH06716.1 Na+/H+ antiporter NhaA [Sulfurospirillum multivorans]